MSSFFTTPASQRKRKREDIDNTSSAKRRIINSKVTNKVRKSSKKVRDESISGSGSEDDHGKTQQADDGEKDITTDSDEEDETGAERRLRLAEKYLQNIKGGVDEVGYDAEEIDRDLIAERLQEDVVCAS